MNAWQRVMTKLNRAARVILHDLFGENDFAETVPVRPGSIPLEPVQLGPLQAQLDALAPELARLEARHKQSEDELAIRAVGLAALDAEIDQALMRGDDEQGRALATRRLELARQYRDLSQRCQEQARIAMDARAVLERMRKRLEQARFQLAGLNTREQDAITLENLAEVRRELDKALASLESSRRK
jgi:phage shock protein A